MFELYTTSEAAEFLKVTPKTLRTWDKDDEFVPDRREGENRLYTRSQLETRLGMTLEEAIDPIASLTEAKIQDLLKSIGSMQSIFFNDAHERSVMEKYHWLYTQLTSVSTNIYRETKIGYANWILTSPEIGSVLECCTAGFSPSYNSTELLDGMNVAYLGTLNRKWKLYTTAALPAEQLVTGIVKDKKICYQPNSMVWMKLPNLF